MRANAVRPGPAPTLCLRKTPVEGLVARTLLVQLGRLLACLLTREGSARSFRLNMRDGKLPRRPGVSYSDAQPLPQPAYCDHGSGKCNGRGHCAMRLEESVEINRPLEEVFKYVSDVGNYPQWMAHVLEVRKPTPGPPQQGDSFVVAIKSVGRRFETPYERASYEADQRYTDRAVGGPIPNQRWHSAFQEVPGGTRFTRAVEVESGGLLKLLQPLQKWAAERQLEKDQQTLKHVVEAR